METWQSKIYGNSKSTSKEEVYSNISLPQEKKGKRKISNKQFNLTPKGTRNKRTNKTQI